MLGAIGKELKEMITRPVKSPHEGSFGGCGQGIGRHELNDEPSGVANLSMREEALRHVKQSLRG